MAQIIEPLASWNGIQVEFGVKFLVGYYRTEIYAICYRVSQMNDNKLYIDREGKNNQKIVVQLAGSVQNVLPVHACSTCGQSKVVLNKKHIFHSEKSSRCSDVYLVRTNDGYTPRRMKAQFSGRTMVLAYSQSFFALLYKDPMVNACQYYSGVQSSCRESFRLVTQRIFLRGINSSET